MIIYLKDMFESFYDFKKKVVLIFLLQKNKNLLKEIGFSRNVINRLSVECKNILIEQHEGYLDYVKNEDESAVEKFLKSKWKLTSLL